MQVASKIDYQYWEQITKGIKSEKILSTSDINYIGGKIKFKKGMSFLVMESEHIVFTEIVKKIDKQLYMILPNRLYTSMRKPSYGPSKKEAKELKRKLVKLTCNNVELPFLSILLERAVITRVLDVIIYTMEEGNSLQL